MRRQGRSLVIAQKALNRRRHARRLLVHYPVRGALDALQLHLRHPALQTAQQLGQQGAVLHRPQHQRGQGDGEGLGWQRHAGG